MKAAGCATVFWPCSSNYVFEAVHSHCKIPDTDLYSQTNLLLPVPQIRTDRNHLLDGHSEHQRCCVRQYSCVLSRCPPNTAQNSSPHVFLSGRVKSCSI